MTKRDGKKLILDAIDKVVSKEKERWICGMSNDYFRAEEIRNEIVRTLNQKKEEK